MTSLVGPLTRAIYGDNRVLAGSEQRIKDEHKLGKTTAACSPRYDCSEKSVREHLVCGPVYDNKRRPPHGWKKYIHPEGSPYFYNAELRLVVEANMELPHVAKAIEFWWTRFQAELETTKITLPETTEICLNLAEHENFGKCKYYLIDRETQRQYWLSETATDAVEMDMSMSADHLERQLHEHFWIHFEYFPMHSSLVEGAEQQLKDLLGQAAIDQMTSNQSTAPFSAEECKAFLSILANMSAGGEKNWTIARLMRVFAHSQFINRYGEFGARLARGQSILVDSDSPGGIVFGLIKIAYLFILFNVPQLHLESLENLWVDRVVYGEHWKRFIDSLCEEWTQAIHLSSVLLVLDLLFLILIAESQHRLALALSIYASALFGISSIVMGRAYLRRHRGSPDSAIDAATAGLYLENSEHPVLRLQPLAIVYAMPYALALWALAFFSFALYIHASAYLSAPDAI